MANTYPTDEDLEEEAVEHPTGGKLFFAVPEWWITAVYKAGRQYRSEAATLVGLYVWRAKVFAKYTRKVSSLPRNRLARAGCGRRSIDRALAALEKAGLVKVQRFRHKLPVVTVNLPREVARG
jgi:hypothetical protein